MLLVEHFTDILCQLRMSLYFTAHFFLLGLLGDFLIFNKIRHAIIIIWKIYGHRSSSRVNSRGPIPGSIYSFQQMLCRPARKRTTTILPRKRQKFVPFWDNNPVDGLSCDEIVHSFIHTLLIYSGPCIWWDPGHSWGMPLENLKDSEGDLEKHSLLERLRLTQSGLGMLWVSD